MTEERRSDHDLSSWDKDVAEKYRGHGPDGARFVDPDLEDWFRPQMLKNLSFLDLGCGKGPWSKVALDRGASKVTGIDFNPAMLAGARKILEKDGEMPRNVNLIEANVGDLRFLEGNYDRMASIFVGCNLPNRYFKAHFRQALAHARIGTRFIVTAPDSFHEAFTSTDDVRDIQAEIDGRWKFVESPDVVNAKKVIEEVPSILRATFILDEGGKPVLINKDNERLLKPGMPILRRIPGTPALVVDNNYHEYTEYHQAAEAAGWFIDKAYRHTFSSDAARQEYNTRVDDSERLGPQYVNSPVFMVMDLVKRG